MVEKTGIYFCIEKTAVQQSYIERNTTGSGGFINNVPIFSYPCLHAENKTKNNKKQTNRGKKHNKAKKIQTTKRKKTKLHKPNPKKTGKQKTSKDLRAVLFNS